MLWAGLRRTAEGEGGCAHLPSSPPRCSFVFPRCVGSEIFSAGSWEEHCSSQFEKHICISIALLQQAAPLFSRALSNKPPISSQCPSHSKHDPVLETASGLYQQIKLPHPYTLQFHQSINKILELPASTNPCCCCSILQV